MGVTGLVAKPAASILQVTGRTAQSIRNRSKLYQMRQQSFRVRFPRPLSREVPLRPYSWEEAVGKSVLAEAGDGLRFKDEVFVASPGRDFQKTWTMSHSPGRLFRNSSLTSSAKKCSHLHIEAVKTT